uniref:Uncharacterized protein n=1 Tax=Trichobilharzia regenti TaxID=157069 RepID=A0AA85J679_TRIRE|nr:unnamed protein product [Trichobilharzia regenti]CAH8865232.1 unnamed protein product [Trichobilharzia regenti]
MLGSIPTAVIIFVKAVQERLALNIGLIVLAVLLLVAQYPVAAKYVPALIVIFAILMVLYLTGQGIKRCSKAETGSLIPVWLSLITWT